MANRPVAASRRQPAPNPPPSQPASRGAVTTAPKTKAVAVHEPVPEFMQGMRGMGTEMIGQADIETPRIKLLATVSPECEQFDDAKPGHFWHSVAETDMGDSVRIVPLYIDMRAILWRPRHEGGGILARADDGVNWSPANASFQVRPYKDNKMTVTWVTKSTVQESRLLEWGTSDPSDPNSQPAATRMYNMAVALPDHPDLGIGVITLQRSGIRVARKFMGKLKLMAVPSFGAYFTMGSVKDQNDSGDIFYNYTFTAAGLVKDQGDFEEYMALYEQFKKMGLNIKDLETVQDEGVIDAKAEGDGKAAY